MRVPWKLLGLVVGCGVEPNASLGPSPLVAWSPLAQDDDPDGAVGLVEDSVPGRDPLADSAEPELGVRLRQHGTVTCADPASEAAYMVKQLRWERPPVRYVEGAATAVADLDGDGLLDVVLVQRERAVLMRQVAPRVFAPTLLVETPPPVPRSGFMGGSVADVDDDGDLDLLVTGRGVANHLLRNDGGGVFEDVTAASGLDVIPEGHLSGGSSWSDWDGDGDLDLLIAGHGPSREEPGARVRDFGPGHVTYLLRNDGGGVFSDASNLLPERVHSAYTFQAGWFDADHDGDDDLYLVNDFGGQMGPCRLVWNEGGIFRPDDGAYGLDLGFSGMGMGFGDVDGDGQEDMTLVAWREQVLIVTDAAGFYELGRATGFVPTGDQVVGWSGELVDIDNDGDLDVPVAYGKVDTYFAENPLWQPDALFVQEGGGFVDRAAALGVGDPGPTRAILPVDLDRDGFVDLVKVSADGSARLAFRSCDEAAWLTVGLRKPAPNTHAVGATVRVTAGGRTWTRRVRAGGTSYVSGGPPEVHVGLGDVDVVERLEVRWPDGAVDAFEGVTTRQHVVVER